MGNTEVDFSRSTENEQGDNRVKTRSSETQPIVFLEQTASRWPEHGRLDVLLLRALCKRSAASPEQAAKGFTSVELVETVSELKGSTWAEADDPGEMSKRVRLQWKRLLKTWKTKRVGIQQRLHEEGITDVPELAKTEGGGAGHPSRYRIAWKAGGAPILDAPSATPLTVSPDAIRYICEDIEDPGPIARMFAKGYNLAGWRRHLFITMVGGPLIFVFLLFTVLTFAITTKASLALVANSAAAFAAAYVAAWLSIGPLLRLPIHRIVLAPWWMQSVDNDRLLEHQYPPRHTQRRIKAVRYTAECPLCGGRISAQSGEWEFLGRIVGRCEHSPKEHLYSFDHVTRRGKALRDL